jgi:uncharacterized protein YjiS (DUF1127 family)
MSAVDIVRTGWERFVDWRRHERARSQALRQLQYMTPRDFADIGITRAALEFHLNTGRHF